MEDAHEGELFEHYARGEERGRLDSARALERVPELLGIGPHLLATATRAR